MATERVRIAWTPERQILSFEGALKGTAHFPIGSGKRYIGIDGRTVLTAFFEGDKCRFGYKQGSLNNVLFKSGQSYQSSDTVTITRDSFTRAVVGVYGEVIVMPCNAPWVTINDRTVELHQDCPNRATQKYVHRLMHLDGDTTYPVWFSDGTILTVQQLKFIGVITTYQKATGMKIIKKFNDGFQSDVVTLLREHWDGNGFCIGGYQLIGKTKIK